MSAPATENERNWGMACHLVALSGLFTGGAGSILGPLIVWLLKKEDMPFVDDQGKESLNFQITMLLAVIVASLLLFVVIGILLLPMVLLFDLVMVLIASIRANDGIVYRYPFNLRLIR